MCISSIPSLHQHTPLMQLHYGMALCFAVPYKDKLHLWGSYNCLLFFTYVNKPSSLMLYRFSTVITGMKVTTNYSCLPVNTNVCIWYCLFVSLLTCLLSQILHSQRSNTANCKCKRGVLPIHIRVYTVMMFLSIDQLSGSTSQPFFFFFFKRWWWWLLLLFIAFLKRWIILHPKKKTDDLFCRNFCAMYFFHFSLAEKLDSCPLLYSLAAIRLSLSLIRCSYSCRCYSALHWASY